MRLFKKALLVVVLTVPLFLIWLPADHFDHGEVICPSKRFFDVECPGCGLTRGIMHLIHFDFSAAWEFNKLSFPIFIVMGMLWFHILGKVIGREIFPFMNEWY